ncbi:MAG: hypothetical protein DRI57_19580 [Deltaproteobacteria bacterium]|nr:MAG: hypothetical protein DRI57_19580 [Deltaproteobacteria bacterium]
MTASLKCCDECRTGIHRLSLTAGFPSGPDMTAESQDVRENAGVGHGTESPVGKIIISESFLTAGCRQLYDSLCNM